MGQFSYLDTDSERLPEGLTRVGYDADTGIYSFQDEHGNYWEGSPGSQYGTLRRVHSSPQQSPLDAEGDKWEPMKVDHDIAQYEYTSYEDLNAQGGAVEEEELKLAGSPEKSQAQGRFSTLSRWARTLRRFSVSSVTADNDNDGRSATCGNPPPSKGDDEVAGEKHTLKRAVTFDEILASKNQT